MTQSRWSDQAFLSAAHAWMQATASERGVPIDGGIEHVHVRPWSTVFKGVGPGGPLYLKACGPTQAFEPAVIELVSRETPGLVPDVVARHPTEPWVLLRGGGEQLRVRMPGHAQLAVWRELLPRYAELQRRLAGRHAELLTAGLPDRRLERIPELLEHVLADDRSGALEPRREVGALLPSIRGACAELRGFGIAPTLDHDDLHDHNVLVEGARAVIIDWGDASLTHPFLTLAVTLEFAAAGAGLEIDAPEIQALRDAYLGPWSAGAPARELQRAAQLGAALGTVTGALTWYEIISLIDGVAADEPDEMASMLRRIARAIARLERA
ncbi:MAG: aminoglycoside phosphotransferase family protein [Chloroflexota bacterium]|nr:aminoglycoside phosphotransferase family protein [Chloroflexota bacterium]